jgi:hypothetical protein
MAWYTQRGDYYTRLTIRLPPQTGNENIISEQLNHKAVNSGGDEEDERRTFCLLEHRQPIIDSIEVHLCAHPLIPGYSAPTKEGIQYCYAHDL